MQGRPRQEEHFSSALLEFSRTLEKCPDVEYYNKLEDPTDEENDMLDLAFGLTQTSRLGCQVIAKPELDGIRLAIPAATRNFAVDGPSQQNEEQSNVVNLVTEKDLEHLCQLIEMKDGGPTWIQMMDCSTPGMRCQAWRREPKTGPPQYQTRTVFENATPEMVRDFFWDDEFRATWDDMLAYSATIDECLTTGTMIVQWIRKFPLFCSDREYIIGRRIWESGGSYYCVTKGVPCSSVPRRAKPRRVDLYYSSWCIRAVESRMGDGRLIACEVLLLHHEEMGIPWEIAKLGVRHGMWGTVKKFEPGLRAYQKARASGVPLSRPAFMAQITTKINSGSQSLAVNENSSETEVAAAATSSNRSLGRKIPKWLIFGGVFVLACSIDRDS
ncbi:hypothetical protein GH714_032312 [Hevea brasiliensis]|uniref:START domain-containing protein n=1 Tax=Hevea brasiliensis TaxID=3981 RepID=A0A6A6LDK8_HEVBR|nr:hypothetical protein GH714_032312 [Hevea brasiliensis]